jgi:parallel beta-helix repeat protein
MGLPTLALRRITGLFMIMTIGVSLIFVSFSTHLVRATWVEGHITHDTTWKTQNNPFVVINNIEVDSNATLTLEAGVEVRFGDGFSIIVKGGLNVNGNENQPVMFTSNRLENFQPGSWDSLQLMGGSRPVSIQYCNFTYATNGVLIRNNAIPLVIKNSAFAFCDKGISIMCSGGDVGNVSIRENRMFSNKIGIYLNNLDQHVGGYFDSIKIEKNEVFNNSEVGISTFLVEKSTSSGNVVISENQVNGNMQSGLHVFIDGMNTGESGFLTISKNLITGNGGGTLKGDMYIKEAFPSGYTNGYQIQTTIDSEKITAGIVCYCDNQNKINISNNRISDNYYGIIYYGSSNDVFSDFGAAVRARANYNNINDNVFGMNITGSGDVDAINNYWGSSSGPYHSSLNPGGTGNPVNGKGSDLHFIPFLEAPAETPSWSPSSKIFQLHLMKGWNLVSLPLVPVNSMPDVVFPRSLIKGGPWEYEGKTGDLVYSDSIQVGKAYMVKTDYELTLQIRGNSPSYPFTLELQKGDNLVGFPIERSIVWSSLIEKDVQIVRISIFDSTTNSFVNDTQLTPGFVIEPGMGYDIVTSKPGSLILTSSNPLSQPSPSSTPSLAPTNSQIQPSTTTANPQVTTPTSSHLISEQPASTPNREEGFYLSTTTLFEIVAIITMVVVAVIVAIIMRTKRKK